MRYALLAVLALAQAAWAQQAEVYDRDNADITTSTASNLRSQPVLFVHGHNTDEEDDSDFNYQKNWQLPGSGTSFKLTLDANPWLDIEPYYIRFVVQNRSIVEDANEIQDAVQRIILRHDQFLQTTGTKVAIIAYSKGTISTRCYLKNLVTAGTNTVTEFVAISPPNHGTALPLPTTIPGRQLNNGYAWPVAFTLPSGQDFIETLNGHDIDDSKTVANSYDTEAPHGRDGTDPMSVGTLYVSLYAHSGDFVGGHDAVSNAHGRKLARNLASNAVNVHFPITGSTAIQIHQKTVHDPDVICAALYAVAHHRAPPQDMVCEQAQGIPRIPPRMAVKLVLDISGSMLGIPATSTKTKLEILQEAVELFTNLWLVTANPADLLGVTYFGSQASAFDIGGEVLVPMDGADAALLTGDVNALDAAAVRFNLTALGPGLLDGIAALQAGHVPLIPSRHIVLLTDGMQNVDPRVDTMSSPPTLDGTVLDTNLGIKVHTIEVGGQGAVMALLFAIKTATGGSSIATVDPGGYLFESFLLTLLQVMRDNSPQLIAYRRGSLSEDIAEEKFQVNKGARRLVLKLSWPRGNMLTYRVMNDGKDVTKQGRIREGPFFRIFAIDSPADGEWNMKIRGDGAVAYQAAAVVDEPAFRYDLELAHPVVRAGDAIGLTLKLGRADATAVATIAVPGESTGNLLSMHAVAIERPDLQAKDGTPAGRKLQRLVQDESLWRKLLPKEQAVPLTNNGDGTYSVSFGATTVPGPYRIAVAIEAGDYRRSATVTALVRIGAVDFDASDLRVEGQILCLRPRDSLGNFLGPGSAHLIQVKPTPPGPIEDQLDGSYTIDLGPDPGDVRVRVGDDVVFDGPASDLKDGSAFPWGWLLAAIALLVLVVLVVRLRAASAR